MAGVFEATAAAARQAGSLQAEEVSWKTRLSFFVNGRLTKVEDAEPHHTLLWFLREKLGLTGTKLGCGEGGCGACTVTVSHFDRSQRKVIHRAVNACLAPLCSVDGCQVTTIEGLGTASSPHPAQKRVAELHGSQCGFCTPGIVMSLYTTLCRKPQPTLADIESTFDGNLCRCTGYRPILDAAKTFACDKKRCPPGPAGYEAGAQAPLKEGEARVCAATAPLAASLEVLPESNQPDFPQELTQEVPNESLKIAGRKVIWYRPKDLATLLMLKKADPKAKMVAGNTEVGIETKFKHCEFPTMISTAVVSELQSLEFDKAGALIIGGAVTLSQLEHFLEAQVEAKTSSQRLEAMLHMLRWFASAQIRNVAVLAGNVATASPISDMNPVLMALGASLLLASAGAEPREVLMTDFFKSYRVVDMQPEEVICSIKVPPPAGDFEFVRSFKQARRRDDDISIVNACLRVCLKPTADGWTVDQVSAAYGGMAPTTTRAKKLEAALLGANWSEATVSKAQEALAEELALPETVPGGMAAFRQTLALSYVFKFYVGVCLDLSAALKANDSLPPAPQLAAGDASAAQSFVCEDRPITHGSQTYVVPKGGMQSSGVAGERDHAPAEDESRAPVGQPLMHRSALQQCTGEAKYTDDMPQLPGTLHAVLILSERPHAKILSIDTAAASSHPGVVRIFTGADVSEKQNSWGPAYIDEQIFRTEEVTSTGQPLGVVVAESLEAAERAARMVKVQYSDLEAIITIEDAIKAKSFKDKILKIEDGNVADAFAQPDSVIVEGEVRMGGQEHFYLECNAALAVPGEGDELTIHCSTQAANKTQKFAANICGIPCSKVVCKVKRMGGGFGGKETRTVPFSTAVALAAHRLRNPVKINVDRDVDMWITGTRHPFLAKYRAAAGPDGKLRALEATLYCNAGYSMDLTEPVMGRALFHSDGCYKIPNVRVEGFMCITNTTSNTAFRGFGGPQGLMVAEAFMTHLATELKMSPEEFRIKNTYAMDGEYTHFRQLMERCPLQRMWGELYSSSEFARRSKEIDEFNRSNRWRKRGIAQLPTKFGISFTAKFMNQAGALVHVYTDGTVLITHGGTEMGQGLHTKICQIAAKAFGIGMEAVYMRETGTDTVPNASPTAASASSDIYGMAILNACEQIMGRMKPYLEKCKGDFKSAVNAAYMDRCDLSAHGFYATPGIGYDWSLPEDQRGKPFNYFTFGAACSEVEIDVLTGDMRILRADLLMDVGNSLNPAIDIGQVEGAFTQGFGWATLEETVWGCSEFPWLKPGVCFTRGPGTYKIPSFNDTPVDMRVTLVKDSANPNAIHSSRAVGEPPFFLGSCAFFAARAAIASARKDAGAGDGYFTVDLPLTPERIRMACSDSIATKFSEKMTRPRPSLFV
mmetsp:Transcript_57580/g.134925  ORF Transcript_57580/g.134925 Transcript_57580/m.134925 type:complete len:1389 (-) Transcript_57580:19-4185(-)